MRFDRIPSFLALTAAFLPTLSFARYTILEPIPLEQRLLLNSAFDDAITLAAIAAKPPLGYLRHGQRKQIYSRFFRDEDATTVSRIFNYIVGGSTHLGNASFANIAVDVHDKKKVCEANPHAVMSADETGVPGIGHFSVCQPFWWGTARIPQKTCSEAGDVLSYALEWPGTVILEELLHYVGQGAINGQDIRDFDIVDDSDGSQYRGPANALKTRGSYPELTTRNVKNYLWYAMDMYWSVKCRRSFRDPETHEEVLAGSIYNPNYDPNNDPNNG